MNSKSQTYKILFYLIVLILISLSLTNCTNDNKIIIRYEHVGVKNEPQSRFAQELATLVNTRTNGRVEIRVYPNSQLGNISELVDGVKYGLIGMSHHDFSSLSKFYNDFSVSNAPFIFRDVDHALLATNKFPGIRAATIHDVHCAHQGVEHDDMNVLTMGVQIIGPWLARDIIKAYVEAEFSTNEDFRRRVGTLQFLERDAAKELQEEINSLF